MARSETSRTHILLPIGGVVVLALAAIPVAAVGAMPASTGGETQIEKSGTFLSAPAVQTQGFASPERRDLPGFELVPAERDAAERSERRNAADFEEDLR
ncbi:MAG: hypothetical protein ACYC5H_02595 [Methylovirgula sp.]